MGWGRKEEGGGSKECPVLLTRTTHLHLIVQSVLQRGEYESRGRCCYGDWLEFYLLI